ncbi:Kinase-related protein of unknown function (DUF1296) [Abeliophyllum distichum]|uniref:GBF-interacting protein 1 N-terminal domain-containing protein n=1 Tax=Abeliophyllum distichum TaxID=126358 RepID=A0ABD1S244_9LAMI
MVSGSRIEGGPQVLSAGVRKTIQSIKEIVGNHSDAEIYVALKETNMDPNETTQKLLSQDPFHEVKRKRDRKKEVSEYKNSVAAEPRINSENVHSPVKSNAHFDQNARRGGYTRNVLPGASKEFRVVRDNRANQNASKDLKHAQSSTSPNERAPSNHVIKSNSAGTPGHQKPPVAHHSSQALNGPADLQPRQSRDANLGGNDRKDLLGEKRLPVSHAASRMQIRVNDSQPRSTTSSTSSVVGVYSSSLDPVHVPSLNSRSAANIGAIKREVGVVGPRRQSSDNSGKPPSSQSSSFPISQSGREGHSRESTRPFSAISKGDQPSHNMAPESAIPGPSVSRSFSSNQHGSRSHQLVGRQKALQPNKEWKPKSTLKPRANGPGVIGTPPKNVSPPADNSEDLKTEAAQMQDSTSQLNISESQNVIIAAHIRVSEADRCRLTFGSLGTEFESSMDPVFHTVEGAEESCTEPSRSVSASALESSTEEPAVGKQLELMDDHVHRSGSNSPASGTVSDHQSSEKRESSSPENLDNYADVGLVRNNSPSYSPELLQTQDTSELPSFSSYETQIGYDMPYFRPLVDETVRGPGLPSPQEVLAHTANSVPASTIAMVQQQQQLVQQQQQQQQQQLAQMYPQVHVSHFANLMPYRQFLSPVYVPPMPVPGYSNTSAYPHPSNGSSYLVMPGNSSHLTASGLKYGVQQFKPVPTGSPSGFGNFTSPSGYAINTPGVVGSATGHEDSSRLKYKDSNLYVPNAQAETSEMWINPRDLSSLQPTSYYNMPGQTPHGAYLPSHSGHASFNAAGAAQSSHMQFPGMYHPPTQATAMASPHHLGAAIGGNVGVGVAAAAPGAQPAAYQQQPQLGHLNWPGNF